MHDHPLLVPTVSDRTASGDSTVLDRLALRRVQLSVASAPIRFSLWDDYSVTGGASPPVATIRFKNRRALVGWVWDPDLNFGESYMSGAVEIHGDLVQLLDAVYRALPQARPRPWWRLDRANGVRAARHNVHHHYDLGNDFYRLWLDREMVYTCAYFPAPQDTLEAAQIAKMERVCRKLHLAPGDRVLEVGCGWGSLALFMARQYGVSVRAFNISAEQIAFARDRAGAGRTGGGASSSSRTTTETRRARATCSCRSGCSSTSACRTIRRSEGSSGGRSRTTAGDSCTSSDATGRRRSTPGFANASFRAPIPRRCAKSSSTSSSRRRCRFSTSRISACTTPGRSITGAAGSRNRRRRSPRCSTTRSFARGGCYLAGSQVAFTTGAMQLFQVVFARGGSNAIPWTRDAA